MCVDCRWKYVNDSIPKIVIIITFIEIEDKTGNRISLKKQQTAEGCTCEIE